MRLVLDGESLTLERLVEAARNPRVTVTVAESAWERVKICRDVVDRAVRDYLAAKTEAERKRKAVYGVTTGFGEFKTRLVDNASLRKLQENILLSHAVGFGTDENEENPANYFPADVIRTAMILRVNTFLKGHSGVRTELVQHLLTMINRGIVPLVPTRGSLGSSGDLCPLAHLFVVLLGEGWFCQLQSLDEVAGVLPVARRMPGSRLGEILGTSSRFMIAEKEGLALTNGTVFCTALLALAVHEAQNLADTADASIAMTLEAIQGRIRPFDPKVHQSRGMPGQITSAARVRALVAGSNLVGKRASVQDVYSVRCAPQVHGASRDAIVYALRVVEAEMNAATDNPLFFPGHEPEDAAEHEPLAFSAGNFHGQPIGLAADFLAIAVAELANISERRTQMLLDKHHNQGLPANLIASGGLNSGLMIAQYSAASLVSENKVLCHPASVDSIPSSANSEDHVAMATTAAWKLQQVIANVKAVLAIELITAAQAIDWRTKNPDDLGAGTRTVFAKVREVVPYFERDQYLEPSFRAVRRLIAHGVVSGIVRRITASSAA